MSFTHLHVHSEYSLLEASCKVSGIVKRAAQFQMPAVALTDHGNMFAAIEFYFAALEAGVKPIIGMDAYLAQNSRLIKKPEFSRKLPLIALDYEGYQNLCKLSSIGYQEGFYYKPRIDYEVLNQYSGKIIALSGGVDGEIPWTFFNQGADAAIEKIKDLQKIFKERFYLEIVRPFVPAWNDLNNFLLEVSQKHQIRTLATNDVFYLEKDDQIGQEVLICIGTNKTLHDESRYRLGSDQYYFKSADEMKKIFSELPSALENTMDVSEKCNIKFKIKDEKGKTIYLLPSYPTANSRSLKEELEYLAKQGLEVRFQEAERRNETVEDKKAYYERLDYELNIIDKMGFNGYFLIVQDFINWAKMNNIPVGPGRGSGAGSLVAYSIRITDLDPLPNFLLFERFLNPERISMPDFDIDFCQDRRQEVIKYVTEKYGEASVSQIITYGKLQTRAAIRDVGRVLGMAYADVDQVSKLVPKKLGITLKEALEMEPRFQDMMEGNPQVRTLMDLAQKIEGLVRHAGIHAAGVIIADGELVKIAPLYKGVEGENVVQFDMKHSEKIGLIKFDFLGLKTLTLIHDALKLIEKNRHKKIIPQEISMKDPGIYEIMTRGDSAGIFQFEGDGITEATKKIRPSSFADITAINALYRPGPMGMIPDYAKRKHGEARVEYIFPELEEILKETYGIIVYQEQVMMIAAKIANYSLGEADMLRRAMGKKIASEMEKQRLRFLEGAKKNGFDESKSIELFDLMAKFADYGFNKSHAAAYCVVAGQTAWLKNYYPVEFFAALLSTEISDTDKVVKYIKDAQKRGITVKAPHINFSDYKFTVGGNTIYFGLGAIKGVGLAAVESILEEREKLPEKKYSTLEEFFGKVDLRKVNKKVIECLIKAGALDGFGFHRAQIMEGYHKLIEFSDSKRKEAELGQFNLFDMHEDVKQNVTLDPVRSWTRNLELANEKEVLGFYFSGHPLTGYDLLAKAWTTGAISEYVQQITKEEFNFGESEFANSEDENATNEEDQSEDVASTAAKDKKITQAVKIDMGPIEKKRIVVVGLVVELREIINKKGNRMAFAKFEDLSGSMEMVLFSDIYLTHEMNFKDDKPLIITGQFSENSLRVEAVIKLEDQLKQLKKVRFDWSQISEENFSTIENLLKSCKGETQVFCSVNSLDKETLIKLPYSINFDQNFIENYFSISGRTDGIRFDI